MVLVDLRTGRHQLLASVADIAFTKKGDLLAYTVDAAAKDANGLFVFDAKTGRTTPLDTDSKVYNRLAWSDDGKRVFFGMQEQVPASDTERKTTDEQADVDVWNTRDERIQSMQMIRAEQDRNFTFREALDISATRFVKLADETMRDLEVAQDGRWAVGRDTRGYIHDYKRPAADIYRVNTTTGALAARSRSISPSP